MNQQDRYTLREDEQPRLKGRRELRMEAEGRKPRNASRRDRPGREDKPENLRPAKGDKPAPAKKKMSPQARKNALMTGIVVGCIVLFAAVAAALGMNVFVIRNFSVEGGVNYTQAEVMTAMGLRMGQSMFTVNAGSMRSHLSDKPTLILETVEREFPNTVKVTVRETTPALVVSYLNQYLVLDNELRVLSQQASLPEGDYPLITGVVVLDAAEGQVITVNDKAQITGLIQLVEAFGQRSEIADEFTYAPLHYISEINIQNVEQVYLYTGDGYTVELGDLENLERKALWVEQMLPVFQTKGYIGGVLDVSAASAATFIPAAGQSDQATQPATQPAEGETQPTEEETQPAEEETQPTEA